MANFKQSSRYANSQVTKNRSGKDFLILRQPLNLLPDQGDTFITVLQEHLERPDIISSLAYNDPDYWWVIFEFNGIRDPLFDLKIGQNLRIPEIERVLAALTELET